MAETLAFAESFNVRPTGADRLRDLLPDYSRCRLITTKAASNTPSASVPIATWPREMLSNVETTVADPIKRGIGAIRLTAAEKRRCNG